MGWGSTKGSAYRKQGECKAQDLPAAAGSKRSSRSKKQDGGYEELKELTANWNKVDARSTRSQAASNRHFQPAPQEESRHSKPAPKQESRHSKSVRNDERGVTPRAYSRAASKAPTVKQAYKQEEKPRSHSSTQRINANALVPFGRITGTVRAHALDRRQNAAIEQWRRMAPGPQNALVPASSQSVSQSRQSTYRSSSTTYRGGSLSDDLQDHTCLYLPYRKLDELPAHIDMAAETGVDAILVGKRGR